MKCSSDLKLLLASVGVLVTLCACLPHRRNLGDSRTIQCRARRDLAIDAHRFYNFILPQLKYYAEGTINQIYMQPYVAQGSDPRKQRHVFQFCISSNNSLLHEIGIQLEAFFQIACNVHSHLKRLQNSFAIATGSPLETATNRFMNTLNRVVCSMKPGKSLSCEGGGRETDEAVFYRDYLTLLLDFSDFVEFINTNIGYTPLD